MELNIAFLLGKVSDRNGRFVIEYLQFSDDDWEFKHDIVQMAFPTRTQSQFRPEQPFLSADFDAESLTVDELQRCRATISLLLHRYLKSLGVEFLINRDQIHLELTNPHPLWASSADHNTLRMTRILECLGIFGMVDTQVKLHDFLVYKIAAENSRCISAKTVAFWVAAKENRLHMLR